jgi:hypothetical protein
MHKTWIALAALLGCALLPLTSVAQKTYRCGNTFQDRPCNATQASQAAGNATTAPAAAAPAIDAECRQRGGDAQKIAWARESGKTSEQQLEKIDGERTSASRKAYERTLIAQVYEQHGSSAAVRAAIEADCIAEKQKAAETAAAAKALGLQAPPAQTAIPSAAPAGSGAREQQAAQQPVQRTSSAREAQRRQDLCESLNLQLDDVRNRQRAGGTAGNMENLGRQRHGIEDKLSANHC